MTDRLTYENISPQVRKLAMVGLALGMLVACMDGAIVGTCANVISKDLGGEELYSWMITTYLLCESAMVPIAGKMSDRYGRRPLFLIGLILFAAGSIFAGLSNSMLMFIICRGVQGLGGGILMPVAMASVADFYSPEDRGKVQGALGAVFGVGSGIGPLVGGALCEYINWHWVFFINIPIILVCILFTVKKFPERKADTSKKIDYAGITVLTLIILDVLLYFQWISGEMEFISARSIGMIIIGIILSILFVSIERRVEDPVLAPKLIHSPTFVKASTYMFIMGLAMIGTLTFIAMYMQQMFDIGTMECGFYLLPMVVGMMITSMGSGMLVNKTGYRGWIVAGSTLIMAALLLMYTMGSDPNKMLLFVYLFIFGLGLGCVNSTVMISVQNHTSIENMGMTTSAVSLMRNVGSTVGTACYSLIIASQMNSKFADSTYSFVNDIFNFNGTGLIALRYVPGFDIPGQATLAETIVEIFGTSVCAAFLFGGLIYIVALVISFTMDKKYTVSEDENRH